MPRQILASGSYSMIARQKLLLCNCFSTMELYINKNFLQDAAYECVTVSYKFIDINTECYVISHQLRNYEDS